MVTNRFDNTAVGTMRSGGSGGETTATERYEWVRCGRCGTPLWRKYADRLEMVISPRGRQKRTISAQLAAAAAVVVQCEKCHARTVGSPDGTWSTLP